MKQIYFSILSFVTLGLSAQPTLTATDYTPTIGSQFTVDNVGYQNAGSAGTNQTWNYSSLSSSGSSTATIKSPSNTPYSSTFPTANLASVSDQNAYSFMKTSSTEVSTVGLVAPAAQTVIFNYSNPEITMKFPFTYNNTFTDTWAASFNNQGTTFYRSGSTTVQADGYGTLVLPYGTFSNVIRIKMTQTYIDVYNAGSGNDTIDYNSVIYVWYKPGMKNYLLTFSSLTLTYSFGGTNTSTYGMMLNSNSTGIFETNENPMSLNVFPNPAQNEITLSGSFEGNNDLKVEIFNSVGQSVMSNELKNISGSMNERVDLSSLNSGMYFISVINEKTNQRSTIRFNHE